MPLFTPPPDSSWPSDSEKAPPVLLSAEALRTVLDASILPLMVTLIEDGRIVYANPAMAELAETELENLIGSHTPNLYQNPEDRAPMLEMLQEQGFLKNYRIEVRSLKGRNFAVRTNVNPAVIEGQPALVATYRDVTLEEEAQRQLKRENELLSLAHQGTRLSAWSWNPETNALWWDDYHYQLFEVPVGASVSPELFLSRVREECRELVEEKRQHLIPGETFSMDFELDLPSGKRRVIRDFYRYLQVEKEWVMLGTSQDITDDIQTQEALAQEAELRALASEYIGLGSWTWDPETDEVWWDEAHFDLFEISRTTRIVNGTYLERVHPKDRERVLQEQEEILTKGVHSLEYELKLPSGRRRYVRDFARYLKIGGKPIVIGTSQDVTQDVLHRESQQEKLELMRMASEMAKVGFWLQMPDGLEWWDPALCELYQLQEGEAPDFERFIQRFHPEHAEEQRTRILEADRKAREGATSSELYRLQLPDGSERTVRDYVGSYQANGELRLLGIVQDVTEREQEREQLRREIELRKLASEGVKICHWFWNPVTHEAWWDDLHYDLFEVPRKTRVHPALFLNRVHPKDRERVGREMRLAATNRVHTLEYELNLPSGRRSIIRDHARLVTLGRDSIILGTSQDITEEVTLREELEEKLALINAASEVAQLGFWAESPSESGNWWSDSYKRLLQLQEGEPTSFETFRGRLHPEAREAQDPIVLDADHRAREGEELTNLYRIQLPDRSERWIRGIVGSVQLREEKRLIGVAQDVTESVQSQAVLRRTERLSAVGQLAAEIAHDLQQPMSTMQLRLELLSRQLGHESFPEELANVRAALDALEHAKNIIERSLLMVRPPGGPTMVRLSDIVAQALKVVESTFRRHRLIPRVLNSWEDDPETEPRVLAQETELILILQNLLVNAKEAVEARRLREGLRIEDLEVFIELRLGRPGGTWRGQESATLLLSVTDPGTGIPEEVLPRIFEPLFSTKTEQRGSGLGLSMCQRLIQEHEGRLWCENRLEAPGATFRIELPKASASPAEPGPADSPSS